MNADDNFDFEVTDQDIEIVGRAESLKNRWTLFICLTLLSTVMYPLVHFWFGLFGTIMLGICQFVAGVLFFRYFLESCEFERTKGCVDAYRKSDKIRERIDELIAP